MDTYDRRQCPVLLQSGYFARSLQAYGREGEPCDRCARPLRRTVLTGRSCYYCGYCQRRRLPSKTVR